MTMALALTACSDDERQNADNGEATPLNIAANISMQAEGITRAAETHWDEGDQIGVYITTHNTTTIFSEEAKNLLYTFNDGTNYETNGSIYRLFSPERRFYLTESSVDVYGYYPYSAGVENPEAIPVTLSDQSSQESIDLMRAANKIGVNNSNAVIRLLFQHRLTKLVFNLKQGEDLLDDELEKATYLEISIGNQKTTATYNIYTDAFTATGDATTIVPIELGTTAEGYVKSFECLVLPNDETSNPAANRTVTITFYQTYANRVVNTFTIGSTTSFAPGTKYTYNVTVNATSVPVVETDTYTEQW